MGHWSSFFFSPLLGLVPLGYSLPIWSLLLFIYSSVQTERFINNCRWGNASSPLFPASQLLDANHRSRTIKWRPQQAYFELSQRFQSTVALVYSNWLMRSFRIVMAKGDIYISWAGGTTSMLTVRLNILLFQGSQAQYLTTKLWETQVTPGRLWRSVCLISWDPCWMIT